MRRELRRHLAWAQRAIEVADEHLEALVERAEIEDDPLELLADAIQATAVAVAIDAVQEDPAEENARIVVDVAMRRLSSDRQREVVRAIYIDRTPRKQIAKRLGVHPSTVGRIEKEALLEMKETLQTVVSRDVEKQGSGGQ